MRKDIRSFTGPKALAAPFPLPSYGDAVEKVSNRYFPDNLQFCVDHTQIVPRLEWLSLRWHSTG
jgi:hypothetical protein